MKLLTCILLVIYFASTDSAPTTEQPSENLNVTKSVTNEINFWLRYFKPRLNRTLSKNEIKSITKFYNRTSNGILYNVTVNYELIYLPTKYELPFNENDTFKMFMQLQSVLEGYLRDSNHHIVTEKITLDYVFAETAQKELSVDYPNFVQNKIKLLVGDYQYKPNEEAQIKKEIESQIKAGFHEFVGEDNNKRGNTSHRIFSPSGNKQDRYYFISTIPSTNYTLSNVTIYGISSMRSISFNESNLAAYPELEIGPVRGTIAQNFPSTSEELSFKADSIYISVDQNADKVNVKFVAYSVVNSKQNVTLADDQSKFIIEKIESTLASSLKSA